MPNVTGIALLVTGDVITQTRIQAIQNAGSKSQTGVADPAGADGDLLVRTDGTPALKFYSGGAWRATGTAVDASPSWTGTHSWTGATDNAIALGAKGTATADTLGNEYGSRSLRFATNNWIGGAAVTRNIDLQSEPMVGADTYQLGILDNAGAYLGAIRSDGRWYIGSTLDAYITRSGVGALTFGGTGTAIFSGGLSITGDVVPEANNTRALGSDALRWAAVHATDVKVAGTSVPTLATVILHAMIL